MALNGEAGEANFERLYRLHAGEELVHVAIYRYSDALPQGDIARVLGCSTRQVAKPLKRLEQWADKPKVAACTS